MKKKLYFAACLILTVAIAFNLTNSFAAVHELSQMTEKGTVIIDPGHGGEDGGTVGINHVQEKEINLAISLLLRELFVKNGYRVMMTREEDVDLGDAALTTVMERKRSDMRARAKMIDESNADLLLSIHQNHFSESQYHGAQIFYTKDNSKALAQTLQKAIVQELQPENQRLAKETDTVFLLKQSEIPSVIVECGFLSNMAEAEQLIDSDYQQKMAQAIYEGTMQYFSAL